MRRDACSAWRRGPPAPADQRTRTQYVHRGRVQPRLEADPGDGRAAGAGLLDSYSAERQSVGARGVQLEQNGVPLSSLDPVDDLGFALLTGAGGEAWGRPATEASARTGVPIRVHVIGGREGVTDPYGDWACLREVETSGCVLVRPHRVRHHRDPVMTFHLPGSEDSPQQTLLAETPLTKRE
jgi:hypothetical protein